ncbi:MAG: hypothetical protein IH591_08975 [Bacteroidales bacterium]|nr:hypothetical protein [Bacteroidales bacterium]
MRYRPLIIISAILILLITGVLLMNRRGTFNRQNTSFAVDGNMEITGVRLTQEEESIRLRKTSEGWVVNEAGEARSSAVSFLLQTITDIGIKSPLSEEIFKSEILDNEISPVKVEVWSGRKRVKTFLVYKTDSNIYGNIMRRSERSKPFIMAIPGFDGSIGSNFNMNELFWMPFNIFRKLPASIASVEVSYAGRPEESFIVYNPAFGTTPALIEYAEQKFDSLKVKRYISYYTWVPFESWDFSLDADRADSIRRTPPFITIIVTGVDGTAETLFLWHRPSGSPDEGQFDNDRVWGSKQIDGQIFIARYFDLDPLLRKKSYFFPDE